jgi:AbrB family looped-hinge helix DNA binding protein
LTSHKIDATVRISEIWKFPAIQDQERIPMSGTTIRRHGQITIPAEIRRAAHVEEGDPIEVELVEEGILLRPRKVIDFSQMWFWSDRWQAAEREANADLRAGRFERFESDEEFLAALDARMKPLDANLDRS